MSFLLSCVVKDSAEVILALDVVEGSIRGGYCAIWLQKFILTMTQ